MRDWLQSEYHMPEEVHNIISQEVDNSMVEGIALIIHRLSEMPWTTQKDLLDELNISKDKLRELNKLYKDGIITKKEFTDAKKKYL